MSTWLTGASDDAGADRRPGQDERHGERRVVREQPVRRLAVFAERLAVIGGDDDDRVVERVSGTKPVEQAAEHRVRIGDFGVVRRAARAIFGRCVVRRVRIEQVHPGEEGR